jgi:glycosyltransferase involved in cell wall biosynthesis
LISTLGVGDRVHMLPPVPRRDVPGLLAAADVASVLLRDHPSFDQYLPSKIFETMAMRVPILLGLRGEAQRLISDAGAGLAHAPDDPTPPSPPSSDSPPSAAKAASAWARRPATTCSPTTTAPTRPPSSPASSSACETDPTALRA